MKFTVQKGWADASGPRQRNERRHRASSAAQRRQLVAWQDYKPAETIEFERVKKRFTCSNVFIVN